MGEIRQSLDQFGKPRPHTFVKHNRQDYRRGDAYQELPETVHEGIPEKLGKIKGIDKGPEMPKANPFAPGYPGDRHKILKGDLAVPDRKILEDDVIDQGDDEKGIHRSVPLDLLPPPPFVRQDRPIIHKSNNIRELRDNDANLLDYSDLLPPF
jgi:hypothetical protein